MIPVNETERPSRPFFAQLMNRIGALSAHQINIPPKLSRTQGSAHGIALETLTQARIDDIHFDPAQGNAQS